MVEPSPESRALRTVLGTALAASLLATAQAGTIRHDVPDAQYTGLAQEAVFDAVGIVSGSPGYATGTLIAPRWVLTAAHVNATAFTIGGTTYGGVQVAYAPGWNGNLQQGRDLALLKLSGPVPNVIPAEIYAGSGELGALFTLVGFGETGTGINGSTILGGVKRAGTNLFDAFATFGTASEIGLVWDFDHPDGTSANPYPASNATAIEFAGANHDSGAPAFVSGHGTVLLAATLSDAINGQTSYGAVDFGSRVSAYADWIDDTVANRWTGAASTTLATGGNWSDTAAAGAQDIIRFDGAEDTTPYVVNFPANTACRKILIEQGYVSFNLGGATIAQSALNENGSVTVARSSGDTATLTLANGVLASVDGFIGAQAGASGAVILHGSGHWMLGDSLCIGGTHTGAGGTGSVVVFTDATLQAAVGIRVWPGGTLELVDGRATAAAISLEGRLVFSGWAELTDRVGDHTAIVLDGTAANQSAPASLVTGGRSEVNGLTVDETHPNGTGSGTHGLGALTLASSSVVDFGGANLSVLHFTQLTTASPGAVLYVIGWDGTPGSGGGRDQLRFDTALAPGVLGQIQFFDSAGQSLGPGTQIAAGSYFEIVPAP